MQNQSLERVQEIYMENRRALISIGGWNTFFASFEGREFERVDGGWIRTNGDKHVILIKDNGAFVAVTPDNKQNLVLAYDLFRAK